MIPKGQWYVTGGTASVPKIHLMVKLADGKTFAAAHVHGDTPEQAREIAKFLADRANLDNFVKVE